MAVNKLTLETDGLVVGATQLVTSGGGVSVGQNLVVQGNNYVQRSEIIGGNLTVGSNVTVGGNVTVSGNITVSGNLFANSITSPVGSALTLQTNGGTAAVSIDTAQSVTFNANVSFANAYSVSHSLVGTITLSGTGNQFSLTNVNLTIYRQLYGVFNYLAGATTNPSISNVVGDQQAYNYLSKHGAANSYGIGNFWIDLYTGFLYSAYALVSSTASASPLVLGTGVSGPPLIGPTGIGNSTTTIYLYVPGAATKSGTVTIYGVK